MREMVRKAEAKKSWFVAFSEWVESVATFLDEKVRTVLWYIFVTEIEFTYSSRNWKSSKMNIYRF